MKNNTWKQVSSGEMLLRSENPHFEKKNELRMSPVGGVRCLGDSYCMSADVSQFEPHDIVVMAYNHHVVIHAQKVMDDGSVSDTFTHKSLFPEDMDPLSISGTLNSDGTLVISVRRMMTFAGPEPLVVPTYRTEAHL
uniref:SHSP domain-containing protein n=1 Tax=Amphiprion percula TaxID=161767 RepID=A0A3P8RQT7_AMPPE